MRADAVVGFVEDGADLQLHRLEVAKRDLHKAHRFGLHIRADHITAIEEQLGGEALGIELPVQPAVLDLPDDELAHLVLL
jgi:hypothetical protein